MKQPSKSRKALVTTFGVFGYISLLTQWVWLAALLIPLLAKSDLKGLFLPPEHVEQTKQSFHLGGPETLWFIVGSVVTIIILVIAITILVRLPMKIAKTGHKFAESTADTLVPIVTHNEPLSGTKKLRLTTRIVLVIKVVLAIIPALALLGLWSVSVSLPKDVVTASTCIFAVLTLFWFTLEYVVARLLKIPAKEII